MNSFAVTVAALALAAPLGLPEDQSVVADDATARAAPEHDRAPVGLQPAQDSLVSMLEDARRVPFQSQVRIEHRIILRISPPSKRVREELLADMPRSAPERVFEEGDTERCIRMNAILGVQPGDNNRLLLFMRDRKILSATLERSCSSQDFYSGFYVERSEDGRLCSRRDRLQSRAGALCEIARINQLEIRRN